jgi:large subunit ribosomal protein L1
MSEVLEAIKKAREAGKERKFKQTLDLAITIRALDLKKTDNRFKTEVLLPNPLPKSYSVGVFADLLTPKVKALGDESVILIKKDEIAGLGKDKKKAKKLANKCKVFLAEAPLMPTVGKFLGPILAVRGKMPKPIPPTIPNIEPLIKKNQAIYKLQLKEMPVVHCPVGHEEMDDQKIVENIEAVVNTVKGALPRGKDNVKELFLKTTMGKAVKFSM